MKNQMYTLVFILLYLSFITACSAESKLADIEKKFDKPNVVFILVDDLGYSDIGAYNENTFYDTPNIDALAAQGTQFTNGYAANPVCSPSRYAILTGKHPSRVDATEWFHINNWPHRTEKFNPAQVHQQLDLEEKTLAESFKEAGYSTAFLGKWHLGEEERFWPEHHGFDINVGGNSNGQPPNGYFSPYKNKRLTDGEKGEYLTERLTTEAINIIDESAKKSAPFFLYLSFYTVHTPLQAPKETVEYYQTKSDKTNIQDSFKSEEQIWPTDEPRLVRVKQNHPTYASMILKMDTQVGRILQKLEAEGLDENTIIVFTSDNGGLSTSEGSPTSNLPLRGGKGWLYEGGIRVPYIIKLPGAKPQKIDVPVVATDFYPTLLEAADLPTNPEQHQDGVSLTSLLANGGKLAARPIFFHYPHYSNQGGFPGAAVRLGHWKLLERYEDGKLQLFNVTKDISELNDLAKEQPEKTTELQALLHHWYKEVDAKFLQDKSGVQPWSNSIK